MIFSFAAGSVVGTQGRKRKLEISELADIKNKIREGAMSLKTLTTENVRLEMQHKILKKNGCNSLAEPEVFARISPRTVSTYIKDMLCHELKGKIQAESRVEPFNDIKNCIAKAAGMSAINELVDEQHFHSDDELGCFLNGWGKNAGKPKLVVCDVSNAWLKTHNISASKSDDPNQQRVVHIGTTQQPSTGELTCFYCRIVDSNFPNEYRHDNREEQKPIIFCLNEREHVYCVCCNEKVTDEVVCEYIGKYIISDAIAERQQLCIDRDINCARMGVNAGQIFGPGFQPLTISDDLLEG